MNIFDFIKGKEDDSFSKKVVKATIIFFIIIILFTIISRTASSMTSAQVKTALPQKQNIVNNVSGTGEITGKKEKAIVLPAGLTVEEINVSDGEQIKKDDILFIINSNEYKKIPSTEKANTDNIKKITDKGEVIADYSGIITSINIKPGDKTTGNGDILYNDSSEGLIINICITDEERVNIKIGDKATIGSEQITIEDAKVKSIVQMPEEQGVHSLVIELPKCDLKAGSMASVDIVSSSGYYDCCIPKDALHQDSSGEYFVYVLSETKNVLGKQLIAQKEIVNVVDKNNEYVALDEFGVGQEVIIESNKELEDECKIRRIEQ